MAEKKGTLSINSDNIFPIIKKWLYSDHDIFFRELISNGCDAITKLKKLDMMGEYNFPEGHKNKVEVILDPEKKTLKFIDTGLGMTADEVEKYITQIAFSGATQFLEQYKDKTEGDQIIGHFGLGFYSAFMVADEVTIDTLSYKEGAEPVHWTCDGGTEYTMATGTKETVGTELPHVCRGHYQRPHPPGGLRRFRPEVRRCGFGVQSVFHGVQSSPASGKRRPGSRVRGAADGIFP